MLLFNMCVLCVFGVTRVGIIVDKKNITRLFLRPFWPGNQRSDLPGQNFLSLKLPSSGITCPASLPSVLRCLFRLPTEISSDEKPLRAERAGKVVGVTETPTSVSTAVLIFIKIHHFRFPTQSSLIISLRSVWPAWASLPCL